jgi:hypothetical protein
MSYFSIIFVTNKVYSMNSNLGTTFPSISTFSRNIAFGLTRNAFSQNSSELYSALYTTSSSSVSLYFATQTTS